MMLRILVYLPAFIFWLPFAGLFRIAGKLARDPRLMNWALFGVHVADERFVLFLSDEEKTRLQSATRIAQGGRR